MKSSNISYLRNHLSEVLNCVREGESVTVLDRRKPVARLVPYSEGKGSAGERIKALQMSGLLVHRPSGTEVKLGPPLKLKEPISLTALIEEDRGPM